MQLFEFYEKSISGEIDFEDALKLYENFDAYDLLYLAYRIKKAFKKNKMDLCSIINAKSGKCSENCAFCSQSMYHKTDIQVYPLKSKEEIINKAKRMEKCCNRFSIVVSGKSISDGEFEKVIEVIEVIKKQTKLKVCASLGIIDKDKLKALKELDVRYHHNLETSRNHFKNICTTHTYDDRVKTIKKAKKLGLEVCSGGIFGLGEDFKERIDMMMDLKKLDVDSVALNILHPIKGTKMYDLIKKNGIKPISPMEALKSIAICRVIMPDREIRLCGGREFNLHDLQCLSLLALDGLMVGDYLTTKGRILEDDLRMIKDMGFIY
jgi:biotin synthase